MEKATTGPGRKAGESAAGAGAGARVLREIIRTPAFLEMIKTNSQGLDPAEARELVRAFLWEDPELSLSMVGTVPELVNYLAAAVLELGRQMNNFPGGLLEQYVEQAAAEIDLDVFRQYPEVFGPLLENMGGYRAAAAGFGAAVNATARFVTRAAKRNPDFVRDAVSGVDWREIGRAAFAVARSLARWLLQAGAGVFITGRNKRAS